MKKLEVLITTMHQQDFSIIQKMNIQSDVILANQCDNTRVDEYCFDGVHTAKMISTTTRGLSKNRNIAMLYSSDDADYIMFSDDDLTFFDGYEEAVLQEFEKHPKAQVIKFGLNNVGVKRKTSQGSCKSFFKANRRNVTSSGTWCLAIKKEILLKKNMHFNEYFGAGTENYCGEDTLFLQELINKKIKMFFSPVTIADINQDETCWFEGYNEKYFRVSGMVLATAYPKLANLLAIRSAYKFSKRKSCNMKFKAILKCYKQGIRQVKRDIK